MEKKMTFDDDAFSKRLAAAKAAPKPTRDVELILDAGIGQLIDELAAELIETRAEETADQRLGHTYERTAAVQEKLDAVRAEARDAIITLRFTRLPAHQWAEVVARCPVRLESDIDREYGFNADRAAVLAAPFCGVRIEGDAEVPLSEDQWRDLYDAISGYEATLIGDAIFELNFWGPAQRVADLKKDSAAPRG